MKQNIVTVSIQLTFYKINVVVILVSVYNDKHRVDYSTIHYMVHSYNMLHTTNNKKSIIVPFLIAGHIL